MGDPPPKGVIFDPQGGVIFIVTPFKKWSLIIKNNVFEWYYSENWPPEGVIFIVKPFKNGHLIIKNNVFEWYYSENGPKMGGQGPPKNQ